MTPTPKAEAPSPCPFCLSPKTSRRMDQFGEYPTHHHIDCINCLAGGPVGLDEKVAIDRWNRAYARELKFRELLAEALKSEMQTETWDKKVREILK